MLVRVASFYWKSCSNIPFPVLADLWQLPRGSWIHLGSTQRTWTLFAETTASWQFRSCLREAHRAFLQHAHRALKRRRCFVTELWMAVWLRRWRSMPTWLNDMQLSYFTGGRMSLTESGCVVLGVLASKGELCWSDKVVLEKRAVEKRKWAKIHYIQMHTPIVYISAGVLFNAELIVLFCGSWVFLLKTIQTKAFRVPKKDEVIRIDFYLGKTDSELLLCFKRNGSLPRHGSVSWC